MSADSEWCDCCDYSMNTTCDDAFKYKLCPMDDEIAVDHEMDYD